MFSIVTLLAAMPWRLIGICALAAALFAGGCQFGANRVTAEWDAEKAATAQVVARQAKQVAAVAVQQSNINQEISNDFQKAKAAIAADRRHLLARVPVRVRVDTAGRDSAVSGIPVSTTGTAAVTANAVPVAEQTTGNAACEKLAQDATQTTLMLVEFQRWYLAQSRGLVISNE
jgi:hypothetical protein